ncbi:hypothetical protein IRY61_04895 [Candidatus Saccharibacteria bacterium]|nr:hypothetical protein [Candidatus Saccharibacteria bacterium]
MASNVVGLRSVQTDRIIPKRERDNRPLINQRDNQQRERLSPAASPVSTYQAPPALPQDRRLEQLADALSSLNSSLQQYGLKRQEALLKEQQMKLPAYVEQIKRDYGTGKITAVQVGEIFPETVPTIRARIAQALGEEWGRQQMKRIVDEVLTNENLRLNTEARREFIERRRAELFAEIGGGNDFYEAGAIAAFEKELNAHELNWQRETAAYHMDLMGKQWQREVVERLAEGGPEALLELDEEWKHTGGLNNQTRNALLVDAVAQVAYEQDNPELLDKIPQRFLNRETKLTIADYKAKIENFRWNQYSRQMQMLNHQREESIREAKKEILRRLHEGEELNPGEFRDIPEAEDYLNSVIGRPRVNPLKSAAAAQGLRTAILQSATTGRIRGIELDSDRFNEGQIINMILEDRDLNHEDALKLINEVPKLLEGISLLRDDDVRQQLNDRLRPHLDQLNASLPSVLERALGGRSLHGVAIQFFQDELRRSFNAYYETENDWPRGFKRLELIEQAIQKTEDLIYKMQQPEYLKQKVEERGANSGNKPNRRRTANTSEK